MLPIAHFPCSFEIPPEYSKLDITLNTKNRSASISGFPTTTKAILDLLGQPCTFDRKRSVDARDEIIYENHVQR